jgi:hypothetical protein
VESRLPALTRSVGRFGWGLSLFALEQATAAWQAVGRGAAAARQQGQAGSAGAPAEALSWAARQQLGDVLGAVFGSADHAQREMVDRLLAGDGAGLAAELLTSSAAFGRCLLPGSGGRVAWQELRNKLEVYWLVLGGQPSSARAVPRLPLPLAARVAAVYEGEPFAVPFALERLGRELASSAWTEDEPPRGLLRGKPGGLPAKSLVLLHSGMGLGFARCLLAAIESPAATAALARAVDRFVILCCDNAAPGYLEAALEPLGVVVRTMYPGLVAGVAGELRRRDPQLSGVFWHGAGRAVYFLPGQLPPGAGSLRKAAEICRREAPPENRADALSGLFYAAVLINLRHPDAVAALLGDLVAWAGEDSPEVEVFASAAAAAVLVRQATTPDDPTIRALLAYRPGAQFPAAAGLWERQIASPCEQALRRLYPLLAARRRFGLLARHQELAALGGRLGGPG